MKTEHAKTWAEAAYPHQEHTYRCGMGIATRGIPFDGIGGRYVMIRFQRVDRKRAKIELYKIVDGHELFLGYVPASAWLRRHPCSKCAAVGGAPCVSLGRISRQDSAMEDVHRNRRKDDGRGIELRTNLLAYFARK